MNANYQTIKVDTRLILIDVITHLSHKIEFPTIPKESVVGVQSHSSSFQIQAPMGLLLLRDFYLKALQCPDPN